MTWAEFVESSYNSDKYFSIDSNNNVICNVIDGEPAIGTLVTGDMEVGTSSTYSVGFPNNALYY